MALLGRSDLKNALEDPDIERRLVVVPLLDPTQIGRGTIDLRLGTEFLLLRRTWHCGLDPGKGHQTDVDEIHERVVVPIGDKLWLHPSHFVLASTMEYLRLPDDMGAYVTGRSSWGRVGLIVATAIFIHPGFKGCLTLELVNDGDSPIALWPGLRIAQLAVHRLQSPSASAESDSDKYLGSVRPQAPRLSGERDECSRLESLGGQLRSRLG